MISWETTEPEYKLALEWSDAADGTPVCLDDGVSYDSIHATWTGRLTPSELAMVESIYTGNRLYTLSSTGYLLGPEIDMSGGIEVTILSFDIDGPVDSAVTLYDVTMSVAYGPLVVPDSELVKLQTALALGVPYHAAFPTTTAALADGGNVLSSDLGRASLRSCKWYSSGLTTDMAGQAVAALRQLRGGSFSWVASGDSLPFGPNGGTTSTVLIPTWSVVAESNLTWGLEIFLVQVPDADPGGTFGWGYNWSNEWGGS